MNLKVVVLTKAAWRDMVFFFQFTVTANASSHRPSQLPFHNNAEDAIGRVNDLHGTSMREASTWLSIDRYQLVVFPQSPAACFASLADLKRKAERKT